MPDFLTLQEAAEQLGVHYMTAYRYVRMGRLAAHKEGGTWRVASSDVQLFQHENGSESSGAVSRKNVPWSERLENRLLEGDASGAWKVIEGALTAGTTPLEVYTEVIGPALRSIGVKWEEGEVGVADEHQASVLVGRLMGRLSPHFVRRGRRRGTVIVAGPPGERHSLNLTMASDALRAAGYTVADLGSDLPVEEVETAVARHGPVEAVCIGVLNPEAVDSCRAMVTAARRAISSRAPVILGGSAIGGDSHAVRLGADRAADLRTVVSAVEAGRDKSTAVSV